MRAAAIAILAFAVMTTFIGSAGALTTLPPGFSQEVVASGLSVPTAFTFLPDGRILVAEKEGVVRVIKNGQLLTTPFIDIRDRVNAYWDRGLLGIAADPDFATNGYVYLMYTYENVANVGLQTFSRVVFQEGKHFVDGGWFTSLTVQVRQGGVWTPVTGLTVTPAYPGINDGVTFQTYTFDFTSVQGDAIRIYGVPGGSAAFISVGELEVFGPAGNLTGFGSIIARVPVPVGSGGNPNLEVIRDGDKPPVGTASSLRQYDTYDGANFASEDWIGYQYQVEFTGPKTSRLTRVTAVGDTAAPNTEVVILGTTVGSSCNNFPAGADCIPADSPSHSVGAIRFASDGTMFVTNGDGADFNTVDDKALRSQNLDLLAGKLLHITTSGKGVPNNPFWTGDLNANRSKVWSYGLRNPFRFGLRPGTNMPYLGDVGWNTWEEINVGQGNFGWPCYEGAARQGGYEPKAVCQALYAGLQILTGLGSIIARVPVPVGSGGNPNLEVIRDGDKPPVGTTSSLRQYDTYDGINVASEDWIGYQYPSLQTFSRVVFQEGKHFVDGGWFTSLTVQVRQGGVWTPVTGLTVTPAYPGINDGVTFQTYTFDFTSVQGDAIRIYGVPGGFNAFISVGELEVYGPQPGGAQLPLVVWGHVGQSSSAVGGVFYTGNSYPLQYQGAYFFGDYGQGWIDTLLVDNADQLVPNSVATFATGADGPVDFAMGPDGMIYYLAINMAQLRRIRYTVGNTPPTAQASANPTAGFPPLPVQFSSAGSGDPDGDPLSYGWSFGDGSLSSDANPQHTYVAGGVYQATLTVSDGRGGSASANVSVTANNRPPTPTISAPQSTLAWKVGDTITFSGSATDPDEGPLPASSLRWDVILHACSGGSCHPHFIMTAVPGSGGSFVTSEHGDQSFYEIILTATDQNGLSAATSVSIQPQTVQVTLATVPSGLQVVYDGTTGVSPLTQTTIVGATRTIFVPSPQGTNQFVSWSDGGAQQHSVVVGATNVTFTATMITNLTGLGSIIARVPVPVGSGGNPNLEVIRDGDKPPAGTADSLRQYDTYDGINVASEDWIGYQYPSLQTFSRVVFQEGKHFVDGGWFTSLTVQVRQGGVWTPVTGLTVAPAYPGINDGVTFQTYTFDFTSVQGDAIRIYGVPGGFNAFISVGELEVYGLAGTQASGNLTGLGSIIARVPVPVGSGGNPNLEVIRDGDKPPAGTADSLRQYDTYDGNNLASEDWIGYQYSSPQTFSRVIFQEGKHFVDGGWFTSLTVQVRQGGVWTPVTGLTVTPAYPGINDGVTFQTYTFDFTSVQGDAIRIYGVPGGFNAFISVGELEVFGPAG